MEINYYLDETWYMDFANVAGAEGDFISYHIEHADGADFEIEISVEDIKADNPIFEVSGPREYYPQIQKAFGGEHWEYWIKSVGLLVHSCYEIHAAQELTRKAAMWDAIQAQPAFILPSIDEITQRTDAGTTTPLDEFILSFHMAGCEDTVREYTAFILSCVKANVGSTDGRIDAAQQAPTLIRYGYNEHCNDELIAS